MGNRITNHKGEKMPYIKQHIREKVDEKIESLGNSIKATSEFYETQVDGTLNYTITKLIGEIYGPIENLKYHDFNEIIGMLECCKLEFYRKQCAPYEDIKLRENGSVLGEQ